MTPVVCDASVAIAWYLDEVQSPAARRLQNSPAPLMAPTILLVETANGLLTSLRRGKTLPSGYPEAALQVLQGGTITLISDLALLDSAIAIARQIGHPIYDCLYLALCRQAQAMLATFDRRLATLATQLAIPLWEPDSP